MSDMDGSVDNPIFYFDSEGNGPMEHVCSEERRGPAESARMWLERQRLYGISPEAAKAVEKLIDEALT